MKYRLITNVDKNITYIIHEKTGMYFKYSYNKPQIAKIAQNNLEQSQEDSNININHVEKQEHTMLVSDEEF